MYDTQDHASISAWRWRILERLWGGGALDVCLAMAIFLAALAVRLAWVREFVSHPLGRIPYVDEIGYLLRAEEIVDGKWLPDRPFYQDPLLPYLLAALMKVVGVGIVGLRYALAVLGSLTAPVLFYAGRRRFGRASARSRGSSR